MAVRQRVWIYSSQHNYNDRQKILIDESNFNQYVVFRESNTHWNCGDLVNANCVSTLPIAVGKNLPNYLLILNQGVIESRWFVMSVNFISGEVTDTSKWHVTLLRDVIVDFRHEISLSTARVDRGIMPRNKWTNVLVQPEGLALNEIKIGQIDIKSWDADTQWLTLFYDITATEQDRIIDFDWNQSFDPDYEVSDVQDDYDDNGFTLNDSNTTSSNTYYRRWNTFRRRYTFRVQEFIFDVVTKTSVLTYDLVVSPDGFLYYIYSASVSNPELQQQAHSIINNALSGLNVDAFRTHLSNDYNKDYTNKYTTLRNRYDGRIINRGDDDNPILSRLSISTRSTNDSISDSDTLKDYNEALDLIVGLTLPITFDDKGLGTRKEINLVTPDSTNNSLDLSSEIFDSSMAQIQVKGKIELPNHAKLDELNLGCIAIPYGPNCNIEYDGKTYNLDETSIKSIFTTGWTNVGTAIKDIQILPYCPCGALNSLRNSDSQSNTIILDGMQSGDLIPMTVGNADTPFYYAVACRQSSMDYRYPVDLSSYFGTDFKLDSMTKKVRMVSHNHKQIFEFNPVKNRGIQALSFSYTLMPFNTIFRIVPVFNLNSLYGGNYKDSRGLIWEGGFSLSQVTDAWVEYKLHNSTYRAMFDREIKNLEVSQDNSRAQETLNYTTSYQNAQSNIQAQQMKAGLGVATGLLSAGVGAAAGNPLAIMGGVGALAGAASAGIGIGAQKDIAERNLESAKLSQNISNSQRAEDLAYKQDMFNLNMMAVKSQPGSVAVSTDYSKVNNAKAYFEIYDCTTEEKQFIEDYFRYNGMRVGRFDNILNYLDDQIRYIKFTLLFANGLLPSINNAINAELSGGIFCLRSLFEGGN